ncbi:hypothetical protein FPV67DRAFT_1203019 [Lyophyllum atratum]|nr:hypothetical protein FPV67DRAFT_1203019 [Lyophyllum atratum]
MTAGATTSFPAEVLAHIWLQVDESADLLALGLTSKRLCTVIIPRHSQFRCLRCDLWRTLASQPGLVARFRTLTIALEPIPTISPLDSAAKCKGTLNNISIVEEPDVCFTLLAVAIRCMTRPTQPSVGCTPGIHGTQCIVLYKTYPKLHTWKY